MAIFTNSILRENIIEDNIDIKSLIQENNINIIFGDFDEKTFKFINESFNIPKDKSNPSIYIYIRNKYIDGDSGKPIPHDCTVKLIKNDIYKYKGRKGVPFEVEPVPKLAVDYDIDKKDKKFVIKFIKENKDDILAYWYAPNTPEGKLIMENIRNKLCKKYGVVLNGTDR